MYTEKQIQKMLAGSAYKLSRGIAMKSVLPYDVSQEQYLFDEDGFTKKTQKNTLILQPEKNLKE